VRGNGCGLFVVRAPEWGNVRAVLLLVVTLALAGCTDSPLSPSRGPGAIPEPYFEEYRDDLAAQYEKTYDAPIDERAVELIASLDLAAKTAGLLDAPATPAKLTLAILSPDGKALRSADVDAAHPTARLDVKEFERNGVHKVRVTGDGFSTQATGGDVGASYALSIEILYG
jgi:type IV pilus biogenesis protein CpaD/CtpE